MNFILIGISLCMYTMYLVKKCKKERNIVGNITGISLYSVKKYQIMISNPGVFPNTIVFMHYWNFDISL